MPTEIPVGARVRVRDGTDIHRKGARAGTVLRRESYRSFLQRKAAAFKDENLPAEMLAAPGAPPADAKVVVVRVDPYGRFGYVEELPFNPDFLEVVDTPDHGLAN